MPMIQPRPARRLHTVRYDWAKWFEKRRFTLKKGEDYQCMTHSIAQQIRNQATRRGVRVSINISDDYTITATVYESLS